MTDKYKTCDVCGSNEFYAGVASSGLGPMSCALCQICVAMRAEMIAMIENVVQSCGGIDGVSKGIPLTYFDQAIDSYVDYRTKEIIPIKLKNGGQEFKTKSAYIEWVKESMK